jgi:16S rRNA (cytosine967-C5)-methyltransferase
MKWDSHINSAEKIISEYEGHIPLALFLKEFFGRNRQMGAADRRSISAMVFGFYRLGHAMKKSSRKERILNGLFLCGNAAAGALEWLSPELGSRSGYSLEEKISFLEAGPYGFRIREVFPWSEELSEGIDRDVFSRSFFQQPRMFIRIRNNMGPQLQEALSQSGISFESCGDGCIALPPATKLDQLTVDRSWYQVQDYSSQRTAGFLQLNGIPGSGDAAIWDCCAGGGGKSILMHDLHPAAEILASDSRPSAIQSLQQRFREAGISNYRSAVADLRYTVPFREAGTSFDAIIADVPCSGSGTWCRTPEQLYFFYPGQIVMLRELQLQICVKVVPHLKKGGTFIYITCSVFRKENEDAVQGLCQKYGLKITMQALLNGYAHRADTLFAATLSGPD